MWVKLLNYLLDVLSVAFVLSQQSIVLPNMKNKVGIIWPTQTIAIFGIMIELPSKY